MARLDRMGRVMDETEALAEAWLLTVHRHPGADAMTALTQTTQPEGDRQCPSRGMER